MLVSRRLLNAATRIVLTMSSTVTVSMTSAIRRAISWRPPSRRKNLSRICLWSLTCSMPGRPAKAEATTSYFVGSESLTRNDSGSAFSLTLSTIGEFLNCSLKRS